MRLTESAPLHCRLEVRASNLHLAMLYAGFAALEAQGLVRLEVVRHEVFEGWEGGGVEALRVVLEDGTVVLFDTGDATDREHPSSYGRNVSALFRRMYGPKSRGEQHTHPLGPFCAVYEGNLWARRVKLCDTWRDRFRLVVRESRWLARLAGVQNSAATLSLEDLVCPPTADRPPRVLFSTHVYDPARAPNEQSAEERSTLNQMRVDVVRALRRRFGDSFHGGLTPGRYARLEFPDDLLSPRDAKQSAFLASRRTASIGVATTGLQGSLGFKFAEYLAAGMAVVTEPIGTEFPGPIAEGSHYSVFRTPEQCVELVEQLMADPERRLARMTANFEYFESHVRPDQMVRRALETSLISAGH